MPRLSAVPSLVGRVDISALFTLSLAMPLALAHVSRLRVDHSWAALLHMPDSRWPLTPWPSANEHVWVSAPLPVGIPEQQTHEAELKPSHSLCPLQLVCSLSHRWPNEASRDQPSHSQHHGRLSVKISIVVVHPRILSEYTSLLWWTLTNTFLLRKWAFPCLPLLETGSREVLHTMDGQTKCCGTWRRGFALATNERNLGSSQFSHSLYLKACQPSSQNHCPWATPGPVTCPYSGWLKKKQTKKKENVLWLIPSPSSCSLLLK